MSPSRTTDGALRFLAGLLWAGVATAADLAVLPTGIALGPGHDREAVALTNHGRDAVVIQADAVSWTQSDGGDHYQASDALIVNPPLFSIPPGRTQVVRVGLREAPDGSRESAYRLLLREVPAPPAAPDGDVRAPAAVRILLQLRLPVYVAPATPLRAAQWRLRRNGDAGFDLETLNTGNVHQVIIRLTLRSDGTADGSPPLADIRTSTPVFAGQRHVWRLQPEHPLPPRLRLDVTTDRDVQHVPIDVGG